MQHCDSPSPKGNASGALVQPWMPNRSPHFGHPVSRGGLSLSNSASE